MNPSKRDICSAGDLNLLVSFRVKDMNDNIDTLEWKSWCDGYFSKYLIEK
jgi:hypothetical protein